MSAFRTDGLGRPWLGDFIGSWYHSNECIFVACDMTTANRRELEALAPEGYSVEDEGNGEGFVLQPAEAWEVGAVSRPMHDADALYVVLLLAESALEVADAGGLEVIGEVRDAIERVREMQLEEQRDKDANHGGGES